MWLYENIRLRISTNTFALFLKKFFIADASKHENVDRLGSVRLPLVRLLGNSYGGVSNKTWQPGRGRTCGGARQVLFCTKTLHQPHNKAEVSSLLLLLINTPQKNWIEMFKNYFSSCSFSFFSQQHHLAFLTYKS